MLFNNSRLNVFKESDKERNLYYKIFAGCLFNELIPENNLPKIFINKLIEKYIETSNSLFDECIINEVDRIDKAITNLTELIEDFNEEKLNVNFDYYLYRVIDTRCRGELADILISGEKSFIEIEAKYKTDYSYKKDIEINGSRITEVSNQKNCMGFQVLLVTKSKFEQSKKQKNNGRGSNYNKLKRYIQETNNPVIILFWEDILDIISNFNEDNYREINKLKEYLKNQLI